MAYWNRQTQTFWALEQQARRRARKEANISLLTAAINAAFGNNEEGAIYERESVSDFSATQSDLSGNENDAALSGDTYSVTLPDLGTDATVAYATPESIVIVDGQTVSGSTDLADRWLFYVIVDRALTSEERETLVAWLGSKGATEPDYFVDSVNGSDANDGSTADAAFETLGKAETEALSFGDGVHIGLVAGSEWRGTIDLSSLDAVKTCGVGELIDGGLPVVRGDNVLGSSWDDSTARADSFSNVYSQSFAFETQSNEASWWHAVWEDDSRLDWAADLATCDSTPGTFYIQSGGTIGTDSSPLTIYIHPNDSTNPNSDGKTYEASARSYAVHVGDSATVAAVYATRAAAQLGHIVAGRFATVRGCIGYDGVMHDINAESGTQSYCYSLIDHQESRTGKIALEFFRLDATGLSGTWDHCCVNVTVDEAGGNNHIAIGGHVQSGTTQYYDRISLKSCSVEGGRLSFGDANAIVSNGVKAQGAPVFAMKAKGGETSHSDLWAVNTKILDDGADNLMALDGLRVAVTVNTVNPAIDQPLNTEITGSVFYSSTGTTGAYRAIFERNRTPVSVGIERCIFATDIFRDCYETRDIVPSAADNVYNRSGSWEWNVDDGAGGLNQYTALTDLQSGEETEQGSVAATGDFADPANGDWDFSGSLGSTGAGLERPNIEYTPIPATLAEAETWIIKNAE